MTGRIEFVGWDGIAGTLPDESTKIIEFLGDSITEGVLVDEKLGEGFGYHGRVYQDDVTAAYAWKTAELLNCEPIISAYGGLGVTQRGDNVPVAPDFYLYCFDEAPISYLNADYIIINFGANDRQSIPEIYISEYNRLLKVVSNHNPESRIILLQPFCGVFLDELKEIKNNYNQRNERKLELIETSGWIPEEPLHPARQTHSIIANKLANALLELGLS